MKKEEMLKEVEEMMVFYNEFLNQIQIDRWYDIFRHYKLEYFKRSVRDYYKYDRTRRMPSIGDIIHGIENYVGNTNIAHDENECSIKIEINPEDIKPLIPIKISTGTIEKTSIGGNNA